MNNLYSTADEIEWDMYGDADSGCVHAIYDELELDSFMNAVSSAKKTKARNGVVRYTFDDGSIISMTRWNQWRVGHWTCNCSKQNHFYTCNFYNDQEKPLW